MIGQKSRSRETLLRTATEAVRNDVNPHASEVASLATLEAVRGAADTFLAKRQAQGRSAWRLRHETNGLVQTAHEIGPKIGLLLECAFGTHVSPKTADRLSKRRGEALLALLGGPPPGVEQTRRALAAYVTGFQGVPNRTPQPLDKTALALNVALDAHDRGEVAALYEWACSHIEASSGSGKMSKRELNLVGLVTQYVRRDLSSEGGAGRLLDWISGSSQPNRWSLVGLAAVVHDSADLLTGLVAAGMPLETVAYGTTTPLLMRAVAGERVEATAALLAAGAGEVLDKKGRPWSEACQKEIARRKSSRLAAAQRDPSKVLADTSQAHRLTAAQTKALDLAKVASERSSKAASGKLLKKLERLGYSAEDADRLRVYLEREADLNINFPMAHATDYATSHSYVSRPHELARRGEHLMFHFAYWNESERVKYGTLNGARSRSGFPGFGESMLVLSDRLRDRTTVRLYENTSLCDTQRRLGRVGTLKDLDHVICRLDNATLKELVLASRGDKSARPWSAASQLEVHVHGPLDFAKDVKKVIVPRITVFAWQGGQDAARDFSQAHGVPVRLRGSIAYSTSERDATLARLNTLGWAVATWVVKEGKDVVNFADSSEENHPHYTYSTREQFYQDETGLPPLEAGTRVVGYHADEKTGSAQIILQHTPNDDAQPNYAFHKTTALGPTLRRLAQAGQHVVACDRVKIAGTHRDEYYVITEDDAERHFEHSLRTGIATPLDLHNTISAQKKDGFLLCGLSHTKSDGYTAIFKRLADAPTTMPTWSMDAERIARIKERSPSTAYGDPIESVPEEVLFVASTDHAFDVNELAEYIVNTRAGQFENWWTKSEFSPEDIEAFLLHPSGAGQRVIDLRMGSDAARKQISKATGQVIGEMASIILRANDNEGISLALVAAANLADYISTLSSQEKIALHAAQFDVHDTHVRGPKSRQTVMGILTELQNQSQDTCFHKAGDFLRQIGKALK